MLGFFPVPYPDELLYGLCARYNSRVGAASSRAVIEDLFGIPLVVASVDLPANLDALLERLPAGHQYTRDGLLDKHTLLPFYAPFLPLSRVQQLRLDMGMGNGSVVHSRAGVRASTIHPLPFLRICPECVRDDLRHLGESYWRRLHQVGGVEVCPTHHVFLQSTTVAAANRTARHCFYPVPVDQGLQVPVLHLSATNRVHGHLLRIANDVKWLLDQPVQIRGLKFIRDQYLNLLHANGFASMTGRVCCGELDQAFRTHFGDALLDELRCPLNHTEDNWLRRLVRSPRTAHYPVRHLLLIDFLSCPLPQFFANALGPVSPFGKPSWPCLNPACPRQGEPVIETCQIKVDRGTGRPIGTFTCNHCAFIYSRRGPDVGPEARFSRSRIMNFGPLWEARLRDLLKTPGIGLRQMARLMGVDPNTINRHALLVAERDRAVNIESRAMKNGVSLGRKHRQTWLEIRNSSPQMGTKELRLRVPAAYAWLRRNDPEWLRHQSPVRQVPRRSSGRVDWDQRDAFLVRTLDSVIDAALHASDRPRRLTVTALAQAAGARDLILQRRDRLPQTVALILTAVETDEDFALRRVRWALQRFEHEEIVPAPWQVIRRAGLRPKLAALGTVVSCINEGIQKLRMRFWGPERSV